MKLRIRGNSIRLRLLRNEVATLAETGTVSEKISFENSVSLSYTISATQQNEISAKFSGSEILVLIPKNMVRDWADSDRVSIEKDQRIDDDNELKILIEKDFVCLERKDDPDNEAAFPHPKMNC